MPSKTDADVIIGGKVYTLSGYESEAYLQKVAAYINNKIGEFDELENYRRFPPDIKSTLLELNIADDYFKACDQAQKLEEDVEALNKEVYDLKHELVSTKMKLETLEKAQKDLEKENRELQLSKAKLETALDDALFGKATPTKKRDAHDNQNNGGQGAQDGLGNSHGGQGDKQGKPK